MNKSIVFGALSALLGLAALIVILAADSQAPVSQWPYEAFQGLTFLFVWALGVPEQLGNMVSALFVTVVLVACFWLGRKLARLLFRDAYQ